MAPLWHRVLATAAARFWSLMVALGILAISAHVLGPHGRGLFAASLAWPTLASVLLYLSLGQVALHEASRRRDDATWDQELLGTLMAFAIVLTLLGWGLAWVLWIASAGSLFRPLSSGMFAVGLLLLPLLIWEQYGSALLAINDRIDIYNRAQVVGRGLALLVVGGLLALGLGVYGVLLGTFVGQVWVAMRGIRFLRSRVPGRPSRSWAMARALAAKGARLHLSSVGTIAIIAADVLIVVHYRGASAAGIYQLGTQLVYVLMFVPQAATLVMFGRVAAAGPRAAWSIHRRIVVGTLSIVVIMAIVAGLIAPFLIPLLAGGGFSRSVDIFRIVLASAPGFALSALMAPQWIGRGLFGTASVVTLAAATANVVANLIVVPAHGIEGAALVMIATSMLLLVANTFMFLFCERERRQGIDTRTGLETAPSS